MVRGFNRNQVPIWNIQISSIYSHSKQVSNHFYRNYSEISSKIGNKTVEWANEHASPPFYPPEPPGPGDVERILLSWPLRLTTLYSATYNDGFIGLIEVKLQGRQSWRAIDPQLPYPAPQGIYPAIEEYPNEGPAPAPP